MVNQPKDANAWLVLQLSGAMTQEEKRKFKDWLSISDENRKSYTELQRVWREIYWDDTLNQYSLDRWADAETVTPLKKVLRHWQPIGALAACLIMIFCLSPRFLSSSNGPLSLPSLTTHKYVTAVGEVKEIHLQDGSTVTLAGSSKIDVSLGSTRRRVKLIEGDAFFDVAHDSSRRFYVESGLLRVEVIGTTFEINSFADEEVLNVISGIVRANSNDKSKTMTVGQQLIVDKDGNMLTNTIDIKSAASWRKRRLNFRQTSLENFVSELNQYYAPGVRLASDDLKDLSVTAAFNIDQTRVALSGVAASLGLKIEKDAKGEITLSHSSK